MGINHTDIHTVKDTVSTENTEIIFIYYYGQKRAREKTENCRSKNCR